MSTHLMRGISFNDDGSAVLEYLTPSEDVRANGLVINHAIAIPGDEDFAELLDELEMAAQRALSAALTAFEGAEPLQLPEEDDDEDRPFDHPDQS